MSLMLEPGELDVVRGISRNRARLAYKRWCDLLGLVGRRRQDCGRTGRPWLALAGLVAPLGMLLSLVSRRVAGASAIYIWLYANNWRMADLGTQVPA